MLLQMPDCPFCGKNLAPIIYGDDLCFAVVSPNPINRYHVLVIPRVHHEGFVDLPDELAAHLFVVAKRLSAAVRKACAPVAVHHISDDDIQRRGYNLVPHYKLHIIPRFEGDGIIMEWKRENLDLAERTRIAQEIKAEL